MGVEGGDTYKMREIDNLLWQKKTNRKRKPNTKRPDLERTRYGETSSIDTVEAELSWHVASAWSYIWTATQVRRHGDTAHSVPHDAYKKRRRRTYRTRVWKAWQKRVVGEGHSRGFETRSQLVLARTATATRLSRPQWLYTAKRITIDYKY